jgi:1,4-dihydroxy-2-naphthoate octaprenyltransferase
MFTLGTATAEHWSLPDFVLAQSMVLLGQLTAHYVNEYADVEADRSVEHRTLFSGGSGVLVDGALAPRVALLAASATSVATMILAGMLVLRDRPFTALLGVVALLVSWGYSMPPVRLLARGWGEAATTIVVVILVPLMGVSAQGDDPPMALIWAMGILVPIHMAMMLAFEIPDLESDRTAGKLVLAARTGRTAAIRMVVTGYALALALLALAVAVMAVPGSTGVAGLFAVPAIVTIRALQTRRYAVSGAAALVAVGVAALSFTLTLAG